LLAAKHPEAVTKLSALFAKRDIRKVYLAVCVGHPGDTTIVEPIGRCRKNRQLMTVYDGPPGKPALTHVRTLAFDGKISAALLRIETGRTHQIRRHLAAVGHPLAGDRKHGDFAFNRDVRARWGLKRLFLHAAFIEVPHPEDGRKVRFEAPLPEELKAVLRAAGLERA